MNQIEDRELRGDVIVDASIDDVWRAWTTDDGVRTFFASDNRVDARPKGPYEIYFDPEQPPGLRGGEGMIVLAIQAPRLLSFTWNAPPRLPAVRGQLTHVTVRLAETGDGRTRVTLSHDGWGDGGEWDEAFQYFRRAWFDVVLPRLQYRFAHDPINWASPQIP